MTELLIYAALIILVGMVMWESDSYESTLRASKRRAKILKNAARRFEYMSILKRKSK